jgi:ABC-2 type transport system permease protein
VSEWRLLRLAIWRELYSRRRGYLITTAIALTLVVGALVIVGITGQDDGPPTIGVGVVGETGTELKTAIEKRLEPGAMVEIAVFASRPSGEAALRSQSISALVIGPHDVLWAQETPYWITETVTAAMREVNITRAAAELDLEPDQVQQLLTPIIGASIDYEEADVGLIALSVISVVLMFVAIIAYGQWIAYGVVEEKANRVAEVILGALSPGQLLTAKLISLGGMGLAQLAVVGGAGLATAVLFVDIPLPSATGYTLAWLVVWFLMGYAFYGSLYAASGSLAADTQEAGSFIGPLNLLPGIGYMVGVIGISAGATGLTRIMSLIPPWTPMLMPARIANGTVAWWELLLAVVMMLVATLAMMRFGAGVYLGGITQATRKVGWLEALRGGRDIAVE